MKPSNFELARFDWAMIKKVAYNYLDMLSHNHFAIKILSWFLGMSLLISPSKCMNVIFHVICNN